MTHVSEPKLLKKKPQPCSERTRSAILETTATLIIETGTEAVSMTTIAKTAGVAVGTVNMSDVSAYGTDLRFS